MKKYYVYLKIKYFLCAHKFGALVYEDYISFEFEFLLMAKYESKTNKIVMHFSVFHQNFTRNV